MKLVDARDCKSSELAVLGKQASGNIWVGPLMTGFILLLLVFVLWTVMKWNETLSIRNTVQTEAEFLGSHIQDDLEGRSPYMKGMVRRWQLNRGTSRKEFESDAEAYLKDISGSQSLGWVDGNSIVRWIIPLKGNERAVNRNLDFEPIRREALRRAMESRETVMTPPLELVQGGEGFLVLFPLWVGKRFDGCLFVALRFNPWLEGVIAQEKHHHFRDDLKVSVWIDRKLVFQQKGWADCSRPEFETSHVQTMMGHEVRVLVRPTDSFIKKNKSLLPGLTAIFGVLISLFGAFMVFLRQKAKKETVAAQAARSALEEESRCHQETVKELEQALSKLDLAVKSGGVGLWNLDITTKKLDFNERMYEFFELTPGKEPAYEECLRRVHPDDLRFVQSLMSRQETGPWSQEFRLLRSDGSTRYFQAAARPEKDTSGQTVRFIGMLWDISLIKQAELVLRRKSEMQNLLMEISLGYLDLSANQIDGAIQESLAKIGRFLHADRVYIFDFDDSRRFCSNTYEWCAEGGVSQQKLLQNIPAEHFREWIEIQGKGETVIIPDVSVMSWGSIRMLLESLDIRGLIAVPMMHEKELLGFVGFDFSQVRQQTSEEDLLLFKLFSGMVVNIRRRQASESALEKSEAQVRLLLNSTAEAIYGLDMNGNCTFANPACLKILGYRDLEELIGKNMHQLIHHSYADGRPMPVETCRIYKAFHRGEGEHVDDEVLWRADGTSFPSEYWSYPQIENGKVIGAVVAFIDITERMQREEQIRHLATHDGLTDLPSLRLGRERLRMALSLSRRHKAMAAVMFIDLDGFKAVNDTYGHEAGDEVLREVSRRLSAGIRETDTAARVGGDEFMLVLTELKTAENAGEIAGKLLHSISKPILIQGAEAHVGASIGIALIPDHGNDPELLIKKADEAMYGVKKSGKNGYRFAGE